MNHLRHQNYKNQHRDGILMYEKTEFLKVKIRLLELEKDFKILKDRESRGGNKKDMEVLFFEPINVSIDDTEAVHGSIP